MEVVAGTRRVARVVLKRSGETVAPTVGIQRGWVRWLGVQGVGIRESKVLMYLIGN